MTAARSRIAKLSRPNSCGTGWGEIAKWWMPDDISFVRDIPPGAIGKIDKKVIRASLDGDAQPFDAIR
ncbi:hypothetical protein [Sphingomonas lycopersici]|uniref:AMP-binding enzyme C-terminal domain-containing protein n=1 Tax=Sphingomonas lycopersici TaxID=2951807 RepID=A0AA42CVL2_9SPHN|nr:hypothetical protein [Sphingomonas lycopersici]MCW6536703.1 hypothetical protein [Sphingomonas lycopersici]